MGKVVDASDATFDEITGTGWVLVDFWAPWCGPCKMVAPILEQIASERDITIAKVNTDNNPNTPGRFGVRGIPTLVLFNEGQVADQRTGADSKVNLDNWLNGHMN
ncbi:MAG: thioredoxin [Candidatus Thermoplasmatota archaeon]|nr:thioredoxin [Candidatus Thermoplasmatota archaeon]